MYWKWPSLGHPFPNPYIKDTPDAQWGWHICLHEWLIIMVDVGNCKPYIESPGYPKDPDMS